MLGSSALAKLLVQTQGDTDLWAYLGEADKCHLTPSPLMAAWLPQDAEVAI